MKRITLAMTLLLLTGLLATAQDKDRPKTYNSSHSNTAAATASTACVGKDGKTACSDEELKSLGAMAGKRRHATMTLSLDKNGALMCDRTPCSPDQFKDIMTEAGPLGLKVAAPPASSGSQRSNIKNN